MSPTGIVATTRFVAGSITETEFEPMLLTYRRVPDALRTGGIGFWPTGIVAVTVFVAVSMTEIEADRSFGT
ncbi:unannotated protein [freshwater metagenome]|uniref:Unannotated protein n=1 Tax=freshwater metagenome TaxID=449393 RepID=A0A6J7MXM0_9ZZZZ